MKSTLLLKKFYLEKKEFINSAEIKKYCSVINLNYEKVIRYFLLRGYLIRIFRGIFYVKTLEEIKFGIKNYSYLKLVSKGLELKEVKNWYFGLDTALKLNNKTYEFSTIDYVISENLYRNKPMNIDDRKFKFIKLKPNILNFGIIENGFKYSDLEKTILDFIYIWQYNSLSKKKIILNISEYTKDVSEEILKDYSKYYPNTVKEIVGELF